MDVSTRRQPSDDSKYIVGNGNAGHVLGTDLKEYNRTYHEIYFSNGVAYTDSTMTEAVVAKVNELYCDKNTNHLYRYDGTAFIELTADTSGLAEKSYVDAQLALKANAETTYTKTEVNALVNVKADKSYVDEEIAKAKPADYEELKRQVINQQYRIDDLEASAEGIVNNWYEKSTENGKLDIPSNVEVAEYAVVEKVKGDSVKSKNLCSSVAYGQESDIGGDSRSRWHLEFGNGRYLSVHSGQKLCLSMKESTKWYQVYIRFVDSAKNIITAHNITLTDASFDGGYAFTVPSDSSISAMYIHCYHTSTVTLPTNVQLEEGTTATAYQPYFDGLKDAEDIVVESYDKDGEKKGELSIPVTLKKGDVFDPNTGMLEESWGIGDVPPNVWTHNGAYWVTDSISSLIEKAEANEKPSTTIISEYMVISATVMVTKYPVGTIATNTNGRLYVCNGSSSEKPQMAFIYKLATPIAPHKVAEPINSQIRIFKGGTLSIKSGVAQAEADIQFHTNVKIKDELDKLKKENAEQNNRITNLEYENRITKAVLAKKIAEETEVDTNNGVVNLPSTGEDGYPLAEWGLLKRLKSESVVWNQLKVLDNTRNWTVSAASAGATMTHDSTGKQTASFASAPTGLIQMYKGNEVKTISGHVYFMTIDVTASFSTSNASIRVYPYSESASASLTANRKATIPHVFKATDGWTSGTEYGILVRDYSNIVSGSTLTASEYALVDLTTMFGVTETSQVTEAMKAWVRTYATTHPEYTAGTLIDSFYEEVVSRSPNLFNKDATPFHDNAYLVASTGVYVSDSSSYGLRMDVDGGAIYELENASDQATGNYNTAGVVYYNSSGQTVGYEAYSKRSFILLSVPIDASYMVMTARKDGTGAYNETSASKIVLRRLSPIDLSFLNSVEDIGIEGTVIDFEKETVTWKYGKVDLGSQTWEYQSNYTRFRTVIEGIKRNSVAYLGGYTQRTLDEMGVASNPNMTFAVANASASMDYFYVKNTAYTDPSAFKTAMTGVELLYELATPVTKTFSELGITIPPSWDGGKPWIRVEAGGTFTVVSTGAPAEATVSFVTDLRRA